MNIRSQTHSIERIKDIAYDNNYVEREKNKINFENQEVKQVNEEKK